MKLIKTLVCSMMFAQASAAWGNDCTQAQQIWPDVKDSGSQAALTAYAEMFAGCAIYRSLAESVLAKLGGAEEGDVVQGGRVKAVATAETQAEPTEFRAVTAAFDEDELRCLELAATPGQFGALGIAGRHMAEINSTHAVRFCQAAAERDHSIHPDVLAVYGRALAADGQDDEAFYVYQRAAEAGSALGMNNWGVALGKIARDDEERYEAFTWKLRAAEMGLPIAMSNVGASFIRGEDVAQDLLRGVALLEDAAEAGYGRALAYLGKYYSDGKFLPRDMARALGHYVEAVDAFADVKAATDLAYIYEVGRYGVTQDLEEATRLYRVAASGAGMAPWAQYRFAMLLHQDVQGYEDFQLGVALLRASAEAGYGKAAFHFGKMLMESTPVENDMFDARRYLSTAVSQDIEGAQEALDRWPALYAERF